MKNKQKNENIDLFEKINMNKYESEKYLEKKVGEGEILNGRYESKKMEGLKMFSDFKAGGRFRFFDEDVTSQLFIFIVEPFQVTMGFLWEKEN